MKKAIIASAVTFFVSILAMSIFYEALELGLLVAIIVMGGFIIYFNDKKK